MTHAISYKVALVLISVMITVLATAQNNITVNASADKQQIVIGERIKFTLEVNVPENQPIRFFQLDTLPHFEFLSKEKIDTSDTGNGTVLSQVIHITSFDSGHWVIPSLVLTGDIITDSIPVDVGYTNADPQKSYNDIKDIIEVEAEEKKDDYKWWYIAAGSLVLLIILLWLLLRKKKKPVVQPVVQTIDPYKEAIAQLELLLKEKPDAKQYYSRLTDIFRFYVFAKKGIHSMQKTTDDLVVQLKSLEIPKEQFEQLSQSLRTSDFVKFAKYIPSEEDDKNSFHVIKRSIDHIEQMP